MLSWRKTLDLVLTARHDHDLPFVSLCSLLEALSFQVRIRGSHHIFSREGIPEILNLQPKKRLAKPYQVKQVRALILRYNLHREPDNS